MLLVLHGRPIAGLLVAAAARHARPPPSHSQQRRRQRNRQRGGRAHRAARDGAAVEPRRGFTRVCTRVCGRRAQRRADRRQGGRRAGRRRCVLAGAGACSFWQPHICQRACAACRHRGWRACSSSPMSRCRGLHRGPACCSNSRRCSRPPHHLVRGCPHMLRTRVGVSRAGSGRRRCTGGRAPWARARCPSRDACRCRQRPRRASRAERQRHGVRSNTVLRAAGRGCQTLCRARPWSPRGQPGGCARRVCGSRRRTWPCGPSLIRRRCRAHRRRLRAHAASCGAGRWRAGSGKAAR